MRFFETAQTLDLGNVPLYWQTIAAEFRQLEELPDLSEDRILSDRAFDEAQTAGPRTYMAVTRYLGVARDNNDALIGLLQNHKASVWAPWTLLRPIFEASFVAVWILEPDSGKERRWRGLRAEVLDSFEKRRHLAAFKVIPQMRPLIEEDEARVEADVHSVYRDEAAALGRSFDAARKKIVIVDELRKLRVIQGQGVEGAAFMEGVWRQLSGYEHGLGWAMLHGSDRDVVAQVPGGSEVRVTVNDDSFQTAAKSTYLLLITACRLLRQRHLERRQP